MRVTSVLVVVSLMVLASRADASPIESVEGTAYTLSLQTISLGIGPAPVAGQFPNLTNILSVEWLSSRLIDDRGTRLVRSVVIPPPSAFQEPSAGAIVLIGLAIVALGSIRLRRRALAADNMQREMTV